MPTVPSTDNLLNGGYDLSYTNGGLVAHVVPAKDKRISTTSARTPKALCGLTPRRDGMWFGTETRFEYDFAGKLPGCKNCFGMKHPEFARRKWVDHV